MITKKYLFLAALISLLFITGCGINNNIILKTGRNYVYDDLPTSAPNEYVITPGDIISFRLYKNDGAELVENAAGINSSNNNSNGYTVRPNGNVELPYLGDINLVGMKIKEAEDSLETRYNKYFRDVFAILQVTNKRIYISPGGVGDAQVITLTNNSTTLLEALALAGGINDRGNSKLIKIIRKDMGQILVYKIDLSTIEGIKDAGFIVQANDFIYVEPMKQIASEALKEITPVLSLISTALLIYALSTSNPFK